MRIIVPASFYKACGSFSDHLPPLLSAAPYPIYPYWELLKSQHHHKFMSKILSHSTQPNCSSLQTLTGLGYPFFLPHLGTRYYLLYNPPLVVPILLRLMKNQFFHKTCSHLLSTRTPHSWNSILTYTYFNIFLCVCWNVKLELLLS